jgi:hypothetical protein
MEKRYGLWVLVVSRLGGSHHDRRVKDQTPVTRRRGNDLHGSKTELPQRDASSVVDIEDHS